MPCVKPTVVNGPHNRLATLRQVIEQDTIIQEVAMNVVYMYYVWIYPVYLSDKLMSCVR